MEIMGLVSRFSRSLKVIGTDTDQTSTCDFLLVMGISCIVSKI